MLDLGCEGIGVLREEEVSRGDAPRRARGESDGLAGRRRAAAEQRRAEEEERIEAGGERARQAWAAPAYDIDHRPDAGAEGARPR